MRLLWTPIARDTGHRTWEGPSSEGSVLPTCSPWRFCASSPSPRGVLALIPKPRQPLQQADVVWFGKSRRKDLGFTSTMKCDSTPALYRLDSKADVTSGRGSRCGSWTRTPALGGSVTGDSSTGPQTPGSPSKGWRGGLTWERPAQTHVEAKMKTGCR